MPSFLTKLKEQVRAASDRLAPDPIKTRIAAVKVEAVARQVVSVGRTVVDIAAKPTTLAVVGAAASWGATKVAEAAKMRAEKMPPGEWVYATKPVYVFTGTDPLFPNCAVPEVPGLYRVDGVDVFVSNTNGEYLRVRRADRTRADELCRQAFWAKHGSRVFISASQIDPNPPDRARESPQADFVWSRLRPLLAAGKRRVILDGRPGTGKTSLAECLAKRMGGPCMIFSPLVQTQTLSAFISAFRPAAVILDDFDRAENAIAFLNVLETLEVPLLLVTSNNAASLDPAIVRAGRFDELFAIEGLGPDYFRELLGTSLWDALSPDSRTKVSTWPAAFLHELSLRWQHLPDCNAEAEVAALAPRVVNNARPTWATTAMTATPSSHNTGAHHDRPHEPRHPAQ